MNSSPAGPTSAPREGERALLLDKPQFDDAFRLWVDRIRDALSSGEPGDSRWALVGVKRRGAALARRLRKELGAGIPSLLYGEVDISLYRDDYHLQTGMPQVLGTEIAFPVDGVKILLVDDVLYTGRTVRAAMDLILDFGRPRVISLAVFIDRGHRELPIAANFVGREISTSRQDLVRVKLEEMGEEDGVEIIRSR